MIVLSRCLAASPRLLYWLTVGLSFLLFLLVIVAPALDNGEKRSDPVSRSVALFARDATLRRTALAASIGLLVTACVFFRAPGNSRSPSRKSPQLPSTPPPVVGA
jgi:hypothetical protein